MPQNATLNQGLTEWGLFSEPVYPEQRYGRNHWCLVPLFTVPQAAATKTSVSIECTEDVPRDTRRGRSEVGGHRGLNLKPNEKIESRPLAPLCHNRYRNKHHMRPYAQ